MIPVIVCKGCWTAYRVPKDVDDWQRCLHCGGGEYRAEYREAGDGIESFDMRQTAHDIGDGPDREPWEDREDREEREKISR